VESDLLKKEEEEEEECQEQKTWELLGLEPVGNGGKRRL
jgi:hypothetical protein